MAENGVILEAQADFAVKLLREVSGGKSTIVSPISVAIALSMVYAGAEDDTAKEMNKMLANGAPDSKVHQYFGELMASIRNGQKNYTLEVANKVYVKEGFSILETYKSTIDQHYGGLFESVNFEKQQETANKINHFVEEATHDKIRDLIQPDSLDALTRLILINAIYFKGNWADKFNAERTEKKTFYASPGQEKQLDMMQKTAKFIYSDTQNYQVLGMPYVGEEVFMFILLPKERYGLGQVLANLSGKELLDLVQMRHKTEVDVVLPKFKLESTHDLNGPLKKLGIARAFANSAQFGGITREAPLQISEVIQKAFIELDEVGTIACAVTLIKPTDCACCGGGPPDPKFIANHPFAFFLASFHQGHYQNEQQIDFYALPTLLFGGIFSETNKINRNYFSAFAPSKFDEKSGERNEQNGFGKLLSSKSNERKFTKPGPGPAIGFGEKLLPKSNENIPAILSLITPIEKVKSEEDKSKKTLTESGNKLVDLYALLPSQLEPIYAEYVEQQPAAAIGVMDVIYG